MVAPAELAHAAYARPVLQFLRRAFRDTRILTFARKLFPSLSENTVLLLASGRGEAFANFSSLDLPGPAALEPFSHPHMQLSNASPVDALAIGQGRERLLHYLLPERTRQLYKELKASPYVARLGDLADIGIGYVSGHNDFFHVAKHTATAYGLPQSVLRPSVRSSNNFDGLRFTQPDWQRLHDSGTPNLLVHLRDEQPLPDTVRSYLDTGVRDGVPTRFKCRTRKPWYRVPHVYVPDDFLSYMSGSAPKLVANEAGAVAPNALHVVRLHAIEAWRLGAVGLAALWQTSLTALSCEAEGHSLGGGMLKLEPTEAEQVAVAIPRRLDRDALAELANDLDTLLRAQRHDEARKRGDSAILRNGLGLPTRDIERLREGAVLLRNRRLSR